MRALKDNVTILRGHHKDCDGDNGCVMDLVSYVCEYDRITDSPPCACPVLTKYAIILNDSISVDSLRTQLLLPLIQKLAGSKSSPEVELRRTFYLVDRAVRLFAPMVLDSINLRNHATTLRNLPEITNQQTAATATAAAANAAYAAATAAAAYAYAATAAAANAAATAATTAAAYAAAAAAYAAAAANAAAANAATDIYKLAVETLSNACDIK